VKEQSTPSTEDTKKLEALILVRDASAKRGHERFAWVVFGPALMPRLHSTANKARSTRLRVKIVPARDQTAPQVTHMGRQEFDGEKSATKGIRAYRFYTS